MRHWWKGAIVMALLGCMNLLICALGWARLSLSFNVFLCAFCLGIFSAGFCFGLAVAAFMNGLFAGVQRREAP